MSSEPVEDHHPDRVNPDHHQHHHHQQADGQQHLQDHNNHQPSPPPSPQAHTEQQAAQDDEQIMEEEADHHQDLEQGTAQAQEVDEEVEHDDDDEDGDDDDDDDDEEEEEDGDNEDVDEDDEENDNDDDDDDDDDDDEGDNDGSDDDSGEDDNMSVISDGLDSSNIIATRPKRAAAAKVSDYTSEEAIRKAGVAPQDEEAAAADGEDADQTYMDADDDDDDDAAGAEGGADATDPDSKPPPKKKQRLPSPSPEPLPKPPPPRPTVRIKMITTQGAGNPSANIPQATPISMDSEEIDPDLYIMEIPHIMLEHLRQQQHPWADWVDETQRDAQKAILAQQEKEAAEKEAERERKAQAAALKAANAANAAAAAAAAAAGGGESEGGGGGGAPPSGGAPDDLPPELAALLARHQEPTVPIKRVVRNRYDVTDPFVDDSELKIDEPTPVVETREKGFYVCIGPVEGFQAAQAKKKTATRRRTAANAATGANANRIKGSAAAAGGSKAGAAAIASPLKAAAQQSQPAEPPGAGQKMQQAMVATTASNQKPAGAKGAIDMLLAMRAKQTGLTVNEHVASGVVKPGTAPPPPTPPLPAAARADGASTDADPDIVEIRPSEMNGQSGARERDDRRKSEGSRTQPIAVDSTDDEDEEASAAAAKKASSSSGAAAAAGGNGTPASAAAANGNSSGVSTRRSRSPAKAAAGADAADTSAAGAGGLGLRRTLRRNASTTAGLNSPAPGGDKGGAAAAASTQVENGKAPSSRPTPDSSAPADISISISGAAPGDNSMLSTNGTPHAGSSTPRASTSAVAAGANGNATSTTPGGTAAAANAPRKNRYPCNPVDPRLAAAFEELRDVVSKEPFEVRTKFPAYLKPPLLKTAKLALELGEYDENFFNWLPTIFPYNRYTMMKLTKREFYEQHHAYYQTLQDETLDALKAIIDKTFPTLKAEYEEALKQWEETEGATAANTNASGTYTPALLNKGVTSGAPSSPLTPPNGASKEAGGGPAAAQAAAPAAAAAKAAPKKRWKWDDEQRAYLHTCITTENAMVELAGEKADLESGTRPFSELARRKILYKRICDLWPEPGWMDTGTISKEYTRTKAKYEKQAARAAEEVEE